MPAKLITLGKGVQLISIKRGLSYVARPKLIRVTKASADTRIPQQVRADTVGLLFKTVLRGQEISDSRFGYLFALPSEVIHSLRMARKNASSYLLKQFFEKTKKADFYVFEPESYEVIVDFN